MKAMQPLDPSILWIVNHGYILMLAAMILEGPMISTAAGFAARLGYFNVFAVMILSFFGNIIPDYVLYGAGRWGKSFLLRHGCRAGVTRKRIAEFDHLFRGHPWGTMLAIKTIPPIALPGLIAAGITKMGFPKYARISASLGAVIGPIFVVLGYSSGTAYVAVSRVLSMSGAFTLTAVLTLFTIYMLMRIAGFYTEEWWLKRRELPLLLPRKKKK